MTPASSTQSTQPAATGAASSPPRWPQETPLACAERLGISVEAAELFKESDVIDLHIDSFIWVRLCGYRLDRLHGAGLLRGRCFRQVDLPRLRQVGVDGATWVITTNPFRRPKARATAYRVNYDRLRSLLSRHSDDVGIVQTYDEYQHVRKSGRHAAFIGIQGGNALDVNLDAFRAVLPNKVLRITLLHLYASALGRSSTPLSSWHRHHLTPLAQNAIELLNEHRVFVDLSHISRDGFFAAIDAHAPSVPPIVTHTGVCGAHRHWRNLDDDQIRAVVARGGIIGIMYHMPYLRAGLGRGDHRVVVDHIEHTLRVGGEHSVALGSDWDGMIVTPKDMPTCLELPRLVQEMLDRNWRHERIQNVLGKNFLRCLKDLRG